MHKVVISGYYGFNNIGDESILTSIIYNLKEKVEDIDITVLSVNPQSTVQKHQVEAINRKAVVDIYKSIKKCDLLISGGGSLLQDVTSGRSMTYYLGVILIGMVLRKKIMIYSQGIGPVNRGFNQWLMKWVLNYVDCITVRDIKSKDTLIKLGVRKPSIHITSDPVIGLQKVGIEEGRKKLIQSGIDPHGKKPLIGFALRGWKSNEQYQEQMGKLADEMMEKLNAQVVFLPFHYGEDLCVLDGIHGKMEQPGVFMKERYSVDEMLSIVGNLDVLVGVRLHSLIFAAVMNIPMVAISYDPKIDSFMESLDLNSFTSLQELENVDIIGELRSILEKKQDEKVLLSQRVMKLKNKLAMNEEIVNQLLAKGER
ncbi:polysaccharide pyruvyl transferase [Alkaliphilus metalliredigens QYMF]|uniref:Polysaccharide pyruvyl transferase n=1 Tax=Alkaliphilus metalliredigens (strain QYMF) TaxID=293826 RepID=A6TVK3_ALKMQ|nr:polysaccharide pyruvyl transferase CsaB [Alkaliphilus metalliredigens]ABR50221.1 polysaccharide pyruvyl transferase [Alkaliphilus metalliredigens QYMF]